MADVAKTTAPEGSAETASGDTPPKRRRTTKARSSKGESLPETVAENTAESSGAAKRTTKRARKNASATDAATTVTESPSVEPSKPRGRRKSAAKTDEAAGNAPAAGTTSPATLEEAPAKKRTRRKSAESTTPTAGTVDGEAEATKPKRTRRTKQAASDNAGEGDAAPKAPRKGTTARRTTTETELRPMPAEADAAADVTPARKRRSTPADTGADGATAELPTAKKRTPRATRKKATAADDTAARDTVALATAETESVQATKESNGAEQPQIAATAKEQGEEQSTSQHATRRRQTDSSKVKYTRAKNKRVSDTSTERSRSNNQNKRSRSTNADEKATTKRQNNRRTASKDGQGATSRRSRSNRNDAQTSATPPRHTQRMATTTSSARATGGRRLTIGTQDRGVSLRADLQKHLRENYKPNDYIRGVNLIFKFEGGRRLRDLVTAVLGGHTPFGNMLSEHAIEGLLDQLTDDYRKCKVTERKGIRAVINWCSGLVAPPKELEGQLLASILSGDENSTISPTAASADPPTETGQQSTQSPPPAKPKARRKSTSSNVDSSLNDLDLDRGISEKRRRRRRL